MCEFNELYFLRISTQSYTHSQKVKYLSMKKIIILTLLVFSVYRLQAQDITSKEEEAIKALVQGAFDDIWSGLEASKIKEYHTDDFLLLEHGEVWTNETIKNYTIRASKAEKIPTRVNTFEFIKFVKSKKSIWAAYHNYANISIDNKTVADLEWLESIVAIKTKEGWKLQMMHSTRVPKE